MGRVGEDVMESCRCNVQRHDRRKHGDDRGYAHGGTCHRVRVVLLAGTRRHAITGRAHSIGHAGHLNGHRAGLKGRKAHGRHRDDREQHGDKMFVRSSHDSAIMGPERLLRKQVPGCATFGPAFLSDDIAIPAAVMFLAAGTARQTEADHEETDDHAVGCRDPADAQQEPWRNDQP